MGCRSYRTSECSRAALLPHRRHVPGLPQRVLVVPGPRPATGHTRPLQSGVPYVNKPNQFAVEIHRGGYATSPTYARNLVKVMRKYKLYRFDKVLRP